MTTAEYDTLERAIQRGQRIVLRRRGGELVIVPLALRFEEGHEMLETRHPTSSVPMTIDLADVQSLEPV